MVESLRSRPVEEEAGRSDNGTRGWLIDLLVSGVTGGLAGAVVAVNVVLYRRIEDGYPASLAEVFEQNVPLA